MVYYYAYLAEFYTEPDPAARKIGVGCVGTREDGRCTFNEFTEYIWKPYPEKADIHRPNVKIFTALEDFPAISIANAFNRIYKWTGPNGIAITYNTDNERIWAGSTDFYDALARVTEPIGTLSKMPIASNDPKAKEISRIVSKGKTCADTLYDLRFKDLEGFRLRAVAIRLGVAGSLIKTNPGRDTLGLVGPWKSWDPGATIQALEDDEKQQHKGHDYAKQNFKDKLNRAITAWANGGQSAINHVRALDAAKSAMQLSC
ncbi:hypothetical protein JDV02_005503 [Purpureocillium takamizusanense]|uniref:Uncharacterized protein n=1 Tax=Purpureocillium takamizusanense TaxID=2060973 RepID=A0A9Q8VBU3_9HYPO|nr:uncharacterized protein JDV02_005503 [Purpureocillium takamizusanense]UNI19311.1 hypothetical protein JDV02_005503 [Purpureocillium takamizusanense]